MKLEKEARILIMGQHLISRTEAIRDYLLPRVGQADVIAFASVFAKNRENHLFSYEHGTLKCHYVFRHPILKKIRSRGAIIAFAFILYFFDFFRCLGITRKKYDLFIGISHFSGLLGLFLKLTGVSKKNIYYAIDYYSPPLHGKLFDILLVKAANFADKLVVLHSDNVWDISSRISEGRATFGGLASAKYFFKHAVVPLGYSRSFFRRRELKDIDKDTLVFIGVIVEGQGLELVLQAISEIAKTIPGIQVRIIGTGPYLEKFKKMVLAQGAERFFKFYGFIEKEDELLEVVSTSAVGISLWDDRKTSFLNSYFGDPGKTKLYSVCGIPVIVSDHTAYSEIVSSCKAGVRISYGNSELCSAFLQITDPQNYPIFKENASKVSMEYCQAEKIFSAVLN